MDIGSILLGILAFVVLLSVIIIIHELGHLITAKKFGVYCHEFSIGMGPRLWHHKFKETTLSLRAIPFGGYVMMAGEDDGSEEDEEMKNVPEERRLNGIAAWKQVIIMAAGVLGYASMWGAVFADVGVALLAVLNSVRIMGKKFE